MIFWITLIRGVFAISLGIALFFQPDKARPILANFMGVYWLVSGIVSLRFGGSGERARALPILAGIIGILAGLAVLTRGATVAWVAEELLLSLLGAVILLTGVMHAFLGLRARSGAAQHRRWTSTMEVSLLTARPADMMCAQMITPFTEEIPIDITGLEPGEHTVVVNGVAADETIVI